MALYDIRPSTPLPARSIPAVGLPGLVLRIAEWQAARRTRQLIKPRPDLRGGRVLRRDDVGRF